MGQINLCPRVTDAMVVSLRPLTGTESIRDRCIEQYALHDFFVPSLGIHNKKKIALRIICPQQLIYNVVELYSKQQCSPSRQQYH